MGRSGNDEGGGSKGYIRSTQGGLMHRATMKIGQATPPLDHRSAGIDSLGRPAQRTFTRKDGVRVVTLDTTRQVQKKPGLTYTRVFYQACRRAGILGSQLSNTAEKTCGVWANKMEMLAQEFMKMSLEPSSTSEAPGTSGLHQSGCCIQTKPPGSLAVQHDQVATEADARKPSIKVPHNALGA